jgi:mannose-6-phosphate isomerase-like protein (cupin superfamily)
MYIPVDKAIDELGKNPTPFVELFKHGTLSIEIYKPDNIDHQSTHDKDEAYIIITGTGKFLNGDAIVEFKPSDFLFVPAGMVHRFFDFSADFMTWVIFYGPIGGE